MAGWSSSGLIGDHLLKWKRSNEWGTRHTAIKQYVFSIVRPVGLPVSNVILLSDLIPPALGYALPQGRLNLIVPDCDFSTILADVTITRSNPQSISPSNHQCYKLGISRETGSRQKGVSISRQLESWEQPLPLWFLKPMVIWGWYFLCFSSHLSLESLEMCHLWLVQCCCLSMLFSLMQLFWVET